MGTISISLPSDGTTADVADYNTPLTTIKNEINGNLDNANIKAAAGIAASKISGLNTTNFSIPYKFSAYRNAAYNTVAVVATKLPFDAEYFDTGSNFDSTTNYRFTAPVAGFYAFTGSITLLTNATRLLPMIYKNGAEIRRGTDVGGANYSGEVNAFLQLAANDYVECWYYIDAVRGVSTGIFTQFSGYLVSAT